MVKKVVFFDSGIGGLSTLSACLRLCPTLNFVYVADNFNSPYGLLSQKKATKCVINCLKDYLNSNNVGAIVLACNTATNCAIAKLRQITKIPIIGTEPAIIPATNYTHGKILVLATPLTVMQPKFESLTQKFKNQLIIYPEPSLASIIETYFQTERETDKLKIISLLTSIKNKYNFSAVVLGCTHYSLIKDLCEKVFQVKCFDGNIGVANQLLRVVSSNQDFFASAKTFPQIITTANTKTNYTKILKKLLTPN